MAEQANEDLIFPIRLEVDPSKFKTGWEKIEPELQKIIDAKPLRAKIEIDNAALKNAVDQLSKLGSVKSIGGKTQTAFFEAAGQLSKIKASSDQVAKVDMTGPIDRLLARLREVRSEMSVYQNMLYETKHPGRKIEIRSELEKSKSEAEALMRQIRSLEALQTQLNTKGKSSLTPGSYYSMGDTRQLNSMRSFYSELERQDAEKRKTAKSSSALERQEIMTAAAIDRGKRTANLATQSNINLQRSKISLRKSAVDLERSELSLERSRQKGIAAVHTQNQAYQAQRGLLNGLPQFFNSYISVLGAFRLGKNIIDVTAEFEMQRVALAAIIKDKAKADELFSKDIELGLQSPFQIKELITATKQLSAYRIETDELFDTTKRLADISAGLGVPMERLILAYGQVKAASVLRGQELRQFTEAGIPLVEMLAEKFTKLRGEMVSTGDVFKIISERGVSFEMVRQIFEDLTNEGGAFYDMQKIQAETLRGSLSNLRDAFDKMFMQMGDGASGPMKDMIDGLRSLIDNWEKVSAVIVPSISALMAYNITRNIVNATISRGSREQAILAGITAKVTTEERLLTRAEAMLAAGRTMQARATVSAAMANNVFTRSFYLLKAAIAANPIGFWVTAITTAVVAIGALIASVGGLKSRTEKLTESLQRSNNEIKASSDLSIMSLTSLTEKLKKATVGSEEYADIIRRINSIAKPHLKANLDTASSYAEVEKAVKGATEAFRAAAKAKAYDTGMQMIETEYSSQMAKQYKAIEKGLKWHGFSGAQASAITQEISGEIMSNPEKYAKNAERLNLIIATVGRAAQIAGVKMIDFSDSTDDGVSKIKKGFSELSDIQDLSAKSAEDFRASLKEGFGVLTGYELEVKKINDAYDAKVKKIRSVATNLDSMGRPISSATALFEAQRKKLTELIAVYERFGNFSLWSKSINDLDKLNAKGKGWESVVDKMTKGEGVMVSGTLGIGATKFARKAGEEEQESYLDYVARLQEEYTKLMKTKNLIDKSPKALIPGIDKKNIEQDIANIKKIAAALGWSLTNPKEPGQKKTDTRIAALNNQLSVIQEAYDKYKKLSATIGAKDARKAIEELYSGQLGAIDKTKGGLSLVFDSASMDAQYATAIKWFGQLGSDAVDEGRRAAIKRSETAFEDLTETIKSSLDRMSAEIENRQKGNDFLEKMIGLTGSKEKAMEITKRMGMVVGDVRTGIQEAIKSTLKVGSTDYGAGVDLGDIQSVQNAINKMREDGLKQSAENAQNYLDQLVSYEQKQLEEIYSGLEKFATAEDRKRQIMLETETLIAKIGSNKNLSPEEKAAKQAAARRWGQSEIAGIDYDTIRGTEEYVRAFEDLDRVGNATLVRLREELKKLVATGKLLPDKLKVVSDKITEIDNQLEQRNPFKTIMEALLDLDLYSVMPGSDEYMQAFDKLQSGVKNLGDQFSDAQNAITGTVDVARELMELMGITFSDETNEVVEQFTKGVGIASNALSVMSSILAVIKEEALPMMVIAAIIGALKAAPYALEAALGSDETKTLEANAKVLDKIERNLKRIQAAEDDSIGSGYVKNIKEQISANEEMLRIEQDNLKQLEKKRRLHKFLFGEDDKYDELTDKINESNEAMSQYYDNIEEREEQLMQTMTGYTGAIDAAYAFVDAWYDAYRKSGYTFDAISEKFSEMVDEMVVKSVLAEVAKAKLDPLFNLIKESYSNDNLLDPQELLAIQRMIASVSGTMDADLAKMMQSLASSGFTVNQGKQNLSGIAAAGASGITEDAANTLGGYLNANLAQLVRHTKILEEIRAQNPSISVKELIEVQREALSVIFGIKKDTAQIVSHLSGVAQNLSDLMNKSGQKTINVNLKS